MANLFAIAIPVTPGKEAQLEEFMVKLMGEQHENFKNSRKALGAHERTFLQKNPDGSTIVIVTLEGDNPLDAFTKFGAADDEFTNWFAKEVKEIHGVDIKGPPPAGMKSEQKVDSEA